MDQLEVWVGVVLGEQLLWRSQMAEDENVAAFQHTSRIMKIDLVYLAWMTRRCAAPRGINVVKCLRSFCFGCWVSFH